MKTLMQKFEKEKNEPMSGHEWQGLSRAIRITRDHFNSPEVVEAVSYAIALESAKNNSANGVNDIDIVMCPYKIMAQLYKKYGKAAITAMIGGEEK